MSSNDKINLYLNTKYKKSDETTGKNNIVIPSGLIKLYNNDYLTISVTAFYMYNTIYQMNNGINNTFQIIWRNINNSISDKFYYSLTKCIGSPNVYNIKDELNELLNNYVNVTYDKIKNIFYFKKTEMETSGHAKMYIKMDSNIMQFLGFPKSYKDKEIEITTAGISSIQTINVMYHQQLFFLLDGDIQFPQNNLDNQNSNVCQPTNILFVKCLDDSYNKIIKYDNLDANASFEYKLINTENINNINILVLNQDYELIPNLPDWFMTIQFCKRSEDNTEKLLTQLKDYLSYLFIMIGNVLFKK